MVTTTASTASARTTTDFSRKGYTVASTASLLGQIASGLIVPHLAPIGFLGFLQAFGVAR